MNLMNLLNLTENFKKQAQMSVINAQAADIQEVLENAKLWGGNPFDLNGPVANLIFGILDKYEYQGKINASLSIDTALNVSVLVSAAGPKAKQIQADMQNTFGPRMTKALKNAKTAPPGNVMQISWLENVGY